MCGEEVEEWERGGKVPLCAEVVGLHGEKVHERYCECRHKRP
jgi:hypothetical protein